jgi:hypothetical protein
MKKEDEINNFNKSMDNLTKEDYKKLQESINDLEKEILIGNTKAFKFIGGPFNLHGHYISSKFGIPERQEIYFPIDIICTKGKVYRMPVYLYNFDDDYFHFTGKFKTEVFCKR